MSRLALITFLSGGPGEVDPGYGVGSPSPGYPSQGLPGSPNYPSQGLPGGGHITTLPVFPFDPTKPVDPDEGHIDNTLPGGGNVPSNELPRPGKRYVVKWLACHGLILVPDNSLPATPEPK